nr:Hsp70 family protein [Clostridium haemolyticum]
MDVYQGEQKLATKNIKIGEFILKGIPKAPAGKEAIEVSFNYDLNGMLQVFAKILSTGKTLTKVINIYKEDSKKLKYNNEEKSNKKDLKTWDKAELYNNFKNIVIFAEKKMSKINDDKSRKKNKKGNR